MSRKKAFARTTQDKVFDAFVIGICLLILLICVYPMYYTIICSVSNPYDVAMGNVGLIPVKFTWESYRQVFANDDIWRGYLNTIIYTVLGTLYNLLLTIPLAYALSKKELYSRTFFSWYFLFCMYFSGGMVPSYLVTKQLGLVNSPWVMIIGAGVSVYNMIVTRVYFQSSIPESLYEAARIDGCSEFKAFFQIALPLAKPIIAVMALYYGVGHWNDYFSAMIYITDKQWQPLQLVLRRILILNENALTSAMRPDASMEELATAAQRAYMATTIKYALVFISSLPMLIAYPFVQKYFVKGVMIGSLKG